MQPQLAELGYFGSNLPQKLSKRWCILPTKCLLIRAQKKEKDREIEQEVRRRIGETRRREEQEKEEEVTGKEN